MGYEKEKMERFVERDAFIKKLVEGLVSRGSTREQALQVVYDSEVEFGDSTMKQAYQGC